MNDFLKPPGGTWIGGDPTPKERMLQTGPITEDLSLEIKLALGRDVAGSVISELLQVLPDDEIINQLRQMNKAEGRTIS